jgi:hypothetical protein
VVRASTDGGQTWSAPQLLMLQQYSTVYVDSLVPPDTVSFHTDTIPTLAVMSVLVDPDGGWHLAATIIPTYLQGRGIQRGDTVDPFEATAIQTGAYLSVGALYGYWAPGAAEPSVSLIAPPAGSSVEAGTPSPRHLRYGEGYTRWIVLGRDAQRQIYAVYVSVKPGDTVQVQEGDATVTYSYGHLYLTAKASDTSLDDAGGPDAGGDRRRLSHGAGSGERGGVGIHCVPGGHTPWDGIERSHAAAG